MYRISKHIVSSAIASLFLFVAGTMPTAALQNSWTTTVAGNYGWTESARWSLTDYPGNTDRTTDDVFFPSSARGTIALNQTMFSSGLTVRTMGAHNSSQAHIAAAGTELQRLTITLGDTVTTPATIFHVVTNQRHTLTNVDLVLLGSATTAGIFVERNVAGQAVPNLTTTNSTITMATAPAAPNWGNLPGIRIGGNDTHGGVIAMNGGALTVTNPTNNGRIIVGQNQQNFNSAKLYLNNTLLTTNHLELQNRGEVFFNNGNLPTPSTISGSIDFTQGFWVSAGKLHVQSGTLYVGGAINWRHASAGAELNVTGGTLNVAGASTPIPQSTTGGGVAKTTILVRGGGVLNASSMQVWGSNNVPGNFRVLLEAGGTLGIADTIRLGAHNQNHQSPGQFLMTGGTYSAASLHVGHVESATRSSDGYYSQTAGTGTISNTITLYRGIQPSGQTYYTGTREFRVAGDSVLNLTGPGFALVTTGNAPNWLLTADDWDTSGTLRFAPNAPVTALTLPAFGEDRGPGTSVNGMLTQNFGIGTLDLTALDGDEKLTVVAAGNVGTNALYVNNLIGLDLATNSPLKHLDSAGNIYYNANLNTYLLGATYPLAAGGQLLGFWVPEPGTFTLLLAGLAGLAVRRRRR